MERRALVGGLLIWSGLIGAGASLAVRSRRESEVNEEAMWRLQNSHEFFLAAASLRRADLLYQSGIASQLALTACLMATGWSDDDCRRLVGQDVGKAYSLAKTGGFQFHSESFARLIPLLSGYGRWRSPATVDARELCAIDDDEVKATLAHLLAAALSHLAGAVAKAARQ